MLSGEARPKGAIRIAFLATLFCLIAGCAGAPSISQDAPVAPPPPSLTELDILPKALEACQLSAVRVVGPDPLVQFGAEVTASQDMTRSLMAWCRIYGPIGDAQSPELELSFETRGAFFGQIIARLIGPAGAEAYTFTYADLIERYPYEPIGFHASDFLISAAEQLVFAARLADGRTRRLMSYRDIAAVACSPQWRTSVPVDAMIPPQEGRRIMFASNASGAIVEDAIATQFVQAPVAIGPLHVDGSESTSISVRPYWVGPFSDSRRPYLEGRMALVPVEGRYLNTSAHCPSYTVRTDTVRLAPDEARIAERLARRFSGMSDIAPVLGRSVSAEERGFGNSIAVCRTITFGGDASFDTAYIGVGGMLWSDDHGRNTSLIVGGSMLWRRGETHAAVDANVSYGGSITGAGGFRCETRILN